MVILLWMRQSEVGDTVNIFPVSGNRYALLPLMLTTPPFEEVVRISRTMVQQKIGACDPFIKALIHILINNLSRVNERYAVQNKMADKLLQDLKASTGKPAENAPS